MAELTASNESAFVVLSVLNYSDPFQSTVGNPHLKILSSRGWTGWQFDMSPGVGLAWL